MGNGLQKEVEATFGELVAPALVLCCVGSACLSRWCVLRTGGHDATCRTLAS